MVNPFSLLDLEYTRFQLSGTPMNIGTGKTDRVMTSIAINPLLCKLNESKRENNENS